MATMMNASQSAQKIHLDKLNDLANGNLKWKNVEEEREFFDSCRVSRENLFCFDFLNLEFCVIHCPKF